MKKFIAIIFISSLFSISAEAFFGKDVKAYFCNFQKGIFENPDLGKTGDPCMEGGPDPDFVLGPTTPAFACIAFDARD